MSQYIRKIDNQTEVLFGWDPPLMTYFAQVYKIDEHGERVDIYVENGHEESGTLLWVGGVPGHILEIEELQRHLRPYLKLDRKLQAALYEDKDLNK